MAEEVRNCVSERIKRFDELYLEVYQEVERRRGAGKAEIDLFQDLLHPSLLAKFSNWIQHHRDIGNGEGKDPAAAQALRALPPTAPLEKLNEALRLAPYPAQQSKEDGGIEDIDWILSDQKGYIKHRAANPHYALHYNHITLCFAWDSKNPVKYGSEVRI